MNIAANSRPIRLIVFSRFPQPGTTKTRLIPALGEHGAADLQRRMTEHIVDIAKAIKSPTVKIEIRYAGGSKTDIERWLGCELIINPQAEGDLGERLHGAIAEALALGDGRIVALGADCPAINSEIIRAAIDSLADSDLVLGPTVDGGYYLIGMTAIHAHLFSGISWGKDQVLAQTIAKAEENNMEVKLLPTLHDIDRPEDLARLATKFSG